jgi:hypothetical protein
MELKTLSEKEIKNRELEKALKIGYEERKEKKLEEYEEKNEEAEVYLSRYKDKLEEAREIKKEYDGLVNATKENTKQIKEQIEKIKNIPMVKEFYYNDGIVISFGDIYINGKVTVDTETKNDIEVPIRKERNVYIGELIFNIIGNEIKVYNKNFGVNGYPHPHANGSHICFGEISESIINKLINLEILEVVKLLYSWAISYNEDDCYMKLDNFYDKQKEE